MLSEDEFAAGALDDAGTDDADMSGGISEAEYRRGELARFATNGDGNLDQREFQSFAETLGN